MATNCWASGANGTVRTAQSMQMLCEPCKGRGSPVQSVQKPRKVLCKACKWLRAQPSRIPWDGDFSGRHPGSCLRCFALCVRTEQIRWLALETRPRYCDRAPAKLQQKEIREAAVTNAREKRLFGGERKKKKKPCLFWRNTYIPSNKSSQRLFLYLRRNRNRHNQGLKRLEITS